MSTVTPFTLLSLIPTSLVGFGGVRFQVVQDENQTPPGWQTWVQAPVVVKRNFPGGGFSIQVVGLSPATVMYHCVFANETDLAALIALIPSPQNFYIGNLILPFGIAPGVATTVNLAGDSYSQVANVMIDTVANTNVHVGWAEADVTFVKTA